MSNPSLVSLVARTPAVSFRGSPDCAPSLYSLYASEGFLLDSLRHARIDLFQEVLKFMEMFKNDEYNMLQNLLDDKKINQYVETQIIKANKAILSDSDYKDFQTFVNVFNSSDGRGSEDTISLQTLTENVEEKLRKSQQKYDDFALLFQKRLPKTRSIEDFTIFLQESQLKMTAALNQQTNFLEWCETYRDTYKEVIDARSVLSDKDLYLNLHVAAVNNTMNKKFLESIEKFIEDVKNKRQKKQ